MNRVIGTYVYTMLTKTGTTPSSARSWHSEQMDQVAVGEGGVLLHNVQVRLHE